MVKLIIDTREKKFINKFDENINIYKNNIDIKQLEIGDFYFIINNELDIIIERKTIDDLSKSLIDKRYSDQKNRLNNLINFNNKKIICIYIIEGPRNNNLENSFWGIITNLIIKNNFFIIQTKNIDETGEVIFNIFSKALKEKYDVINESVDFSLYKKSKSINPENCFLIQLCSIPNISTKKANAIKNKFTNFKNIILKLQNKTYLEKVKEFTDIVVENKNTKRKLGEKTAKKIVDYIFFENLEKYKVNLNKN